MNMLSGVRYSEHPGHRLKVDMFTVAFGKGGVPLLAVVFDTHNKRRAGSR
ncbi:hypothetical protein [Arthrobacter sp. VKM Ac-2550]|nr:hypothetical protein [Arthrobacter sp. VKM Ac-2550]